MEEGEAKRNKHENLEMLLSKKIGFCTLSDAGTRAQLPDDEREGLYLLVRPLLLWMQADDVYERIKKDITTATINTLSSIC